MINTKINNKNIALSIQIDSDSDRLICSRKTVNINKTKNCNKSDNIAHMENDIKLILSSVKILKNAKDYRTIEACVKNIENHSMILLDKLDEQKVSHNVLLHRINSLNSILKKLDSDAVVEALFRNPISDEDL